MNAFARPLVLALVLVWSACSSDGAATAPDAAIADAPDDAPWDAAGDAPWDAAVGDDVVADAADDAPWDAPDDVPAPVDQAQDLVAEAEVGDAPADLPPELDGNRDGGGCFALQPSTKLYEYWCPTGVSTKLCFIEQYIHL